MAVTPSRPLAARLGLGALLLVAAACGSASGAPRPTAPPRPDVSLGETQTSVLGTGGDSSGPTADTAPADTATVGDPNDPRAGWTTAAPLTANPFAGPVGEWVGGDIPHVYPLPDGRQVWWLNDSFVPPDGQAPVDQFEFVRNVVFIRGTDGGLEMKVGGEPGSRWDWLAHPSEPDHFRRFFWPLGGVVDGNKLKVIVAEMECLRPQWGICFYPVTAYLAVFRWKTMDLVSLEPAPNPGVRPLWGFSIASDAQWTYLFGNGMQYNTPDEWGGSDQMFVGRVPYGKLEQQPTYWDGTGWNADPGAAVPLVERGVSDFRMSVVYWKGRWIGAAKEDEFVGRRIFVMEAPHPEGPWRDIAEIPMPVPEDDPDFVTYDVVPYPDPIDGKLALLYSTNSQIESRVFADPSVYRPVLLVTDIE